MSEKQVCAYCKEEFEGPGIRRGHLIFCSEACAYEGGRPKDCAGRADVSQASLEAELEFRKNPPVS